MSNLKFLTLITCVLLLEACNPDAPNKTPASGFAYTLTGKLTNGEGLNVVLDVPESLEGRLTAKVENDTFVFTGTSERMQLAQIRIEGSSYYSFILIEPGETVIKLDVLGGSSSPMLSQPVILKGSNNQMLYNFYREKAKAVSDRVWIFGDSVRMDSMRRLVYPEIRDKLFSVYDNYFDQAQPGLQLILLSSIMDGLQQPGYLDKRYLDREEMDKINRYFAQIDSSLLEYPAYQQAKDILSSMED